MRFFDRRTTSNRETELLARLAMFKREALKHPERTDSLLDELLDTIPKLPPKVQIQTTTRCNAACEMCPYPMVTSEPSFEHSVMSEERYRRILADLDGGGVERLSLFLMNEPLLDKRLADWLSLARRSLPTATLGLFTNGAGLSRMRARTLAKAGLDELCVSVHGFDPDTYERTMAGLSFARLRRNLDDVLTAADSGELGAMIVQIVTGDVPQLVRTQDLAPSHYRKRIVRKALSNERAAVGVRDSYASSARAGAEELTTCQRPFVKLYVLTNGDCVLCNVDWRRTVVLGRVGDPGGPSVTDVWKGEAYRMVRREQLVGSFNRAAICSRCDYAQVIDAE